jgi:hypothetical protein
MNHSIIEKISRLLDLAKSSNIHEATAAAIAADKLIAKFRISEQELLNHKESPVEQDTGFIYESARAITWKYNLAVALAKHYSCFIYDACGFSENNRKVTRLRLTGVKSDIDIAKYMFTWLVLEIDRLNKVNKGRGHIVCNSFCLGAAEGIKQQLAQSKKENLEEAVNNGQIVAIEKLDQRYNCAEALVNSTVALSKSTKAKPHNYIVGSEYNNGINAGKNIHLGKVMNGVGNKLLGS